MTRNLDFIFLIWQGSRPLKPATLMDFDKQIWAGGNKKAQHLSVTAL
jgi:hypothetical protein